MRGGCVVLRSAAETVRKAGVCLRWRELDGKGAREAVAVREFRIAKRPPWPMPTDP